VHDVPSAGSQPEVDRSGVHDDRVAGVDPPGQLGEHVGALRCPIQVHLDALQPGALLEHPLDLARFERRHDRNLERSDQTLHALVA